ncbi:MAG: membrane dipeptidase [Anaerorhabdus sp.]
MNFFNLHDDIGSDIFTHRIDNPNRLDSFHVPRLIKGGIKTTALVCCFCGDETWEDMKEQITYLNNKIIASPFVSFDDSSSIKVFIAVEGMCGIKEKAADKIYWLYKHNVRLASLCWNDHNAMAIGAKSGNLPLTKLGIECIQAMNQVHMAIDVSHCCEWNFYDIARVSNQPIIATHSNVKGLFNHYRNLTDAQLQVIKEKKGVIGAIPVRWFVTRDESKQTLEEFINIITYLKEKIGIENIALGFDFMDYMGDPTCMVKGLAGVTQIQNLSNALVEHGYSKKDTEMICYHNANNLLKEYLIY